jgi:hypothetical protein
MAASLLQTHIDDDAENRRHDHSHRKQPMSMYTVPSGGFASMYAFTVSHPAMAPCETVDSQCIAANAIGKAVVGVSSLLSHR